MARGGWFARRGRHHESRRAMDVVCEGIATKCEECAAILFARDFERNFKVCSKCGYHHRLNARERLEITADEGSFEEMDANLVSVAPRRFPCYADKIKS